MWISRAGAVCLALPSSTVVFVCELTICMEIDQSLRFTRRVMNFQVAVLSLYGLEDPHRLPLAHPPITVFHLLRDCTEFVSLSP